MNQHHYNLPLALRGCLLLVLFWFGLGNMEAQAQRKYAASGGTDVEATLKSDLKRAQELDQLLNVEPTLRNYARFSDFSRAILAGFDISIPKHYRLYSYARQMDSLRFRMVVRSSEWEYLAARSRIPDDSSLLLRQRALLNIGYAYALAYDDEFCMRVANKLDTLGYRFPYVGIGPYAQIAGSTSELMTSVGIAIGGYDPKNKLLGHTARWSGITIGADALPARGVVGMYIGSQFNVERLMLGAGLNLIGWNSYQNMNTGQTEGTANVLGLRAEIGYNMDRLSFFLAGNAPFKLERANQKDADNTLRYWPRAMLGVRFALPLPMTTNGSTLNGRDISAGLKRTR